MERGIDPGADDTQARFDQLGRRAGAALRHPASEAGLATITRRARRRSAVTAAGAAVGVMAVISTVFLLRGGQGGSAPLAPATTIRIETTVAPRSVALSGSSGRTSEPFALAAGRYAVVFSSRPSAQGCGYKVHFRGADHAEDPFAGLRGGSSPDGVSTIANLLGGTYVVDVETACAWSFSATAL